MFSISQFIYASQLVDRLLHCKLQMIRQGNHLILLIEAPTPRAAQYLWHRHHLLQAAARSRPEAPDLIWIGYRKSPEQPWEAWGNLLYDFAPAN